MKLANEAAFRLGFMDVDPSMRGVVWPGGRAELQPRAMQVLVLLVQARGAVVSRDQLVADCWAGRSVSDDAINRIVHLLRDLAERSGGGGFSIQTIARVGYRLIASEPAAAPSPPRAAPDAEAVRLEGRRPPRLRVVASAGGRGALAPAWDRQDASEPQKAPALHASPPPAAPLLAVLAFDNLTGDPGLGYFSDGVSEEIAHTVLKTTGLKVVGRSSSFALRGAEKSATRVAASLGATHLLDGSVRREGGRLRITAQLVSCETQTSLWSDRFDRPLADMFAVQDEIAAAVAAALRVAFAPSRVAGPIDPIAYDLYLRARDPATAVFMPNIAPLEQAVARAPDFAQAWGLLAYSRGMLLRWGPVGAPFAEARASLLEAARAALALDPASALAHLGLTFVEPICGRFAEQRALVDKALAASPHDPFVMVHAAGLCDVVGFQQLAFGHAATAYELDPRAVGFYQGYLLEALGRRQEAQALFDRDLTRWPDVILLNTTALRSAYEADDWARYDLLVSRLPPTSLGQPIVMALFQLAARLRDWSPSMARTALQEMRQSVSETGTVALTWAGILGARGFTDEVYALLEDASFAPLFTAEGRLPPYELGLNVLFSPLFRALRRDIRFVRLCQRLGLVAFWADTGQWPDCALEVAPYYDLEAEARRLLAR